MGREGRPPLPLPQISGLDRIEGLAARNEAGVVRSAASGWPAFETWTLRRLAERLGPAPVTTAELRAGRVCVGRRGLDLTTRAADEALARIEAGDASLYVMTTLDDLPDAIRADAPVPAPCKHALWRSAKLWVSPAGAISPLHFDVAHNIHAQLRGRKRFLVFDRRDRAALYPERPWSAVPNFSRVDPRAPDLARFPRFPRATPRECTLMPGDAVFLPSGTWHHVTSEEASISVNFWWADGLLAAAAHMANLMKRVRRITR
jgi:hypothetical protein